MTAHIDATGLRLPDVSGIAPKCNLEAELDLLAACLSKPDVFDTVQDLLRSEHFYAPQLRVLWVGCQGVADAGEVVSTATVRNFLRDRNLLDKAGGVELIESLEFSRPAVVMPERVAAVIRNAWRQRECAARCQRIAAAAYGDVGDLQAFIEKAEADIGALGHSERVDTAASLKDCIAEVIGAIAEDGTSGGVKSGLRAYDDLTMGFYPGDLVIVGGRPGMGKTAVALQLGLNVAGARTARPQGVAVFSLEMPRPQLTQRALCSAARVDMTAMRAGTLTPLDWRNLTDVAQWMAQSPLEIDDQPAITPAQLRSRLRRQKSKWAKAGVDLRVAVVDYLQLMDGRFGVSAKASREEQVSHCSKSLKTIAKELGITVVACAQLSRDVAGAKDRRPQLHHLRESGSIEQDADVVAFVHREEYYLGDKCPEHERGIAEIIIAKQRNGGVGTRRCRFHARYTLFADLEANDSRFMGEQ